MAYQPQTRKLSGTLQSFGHPMTGPFKITLAHASDPAKDMILAVTPDAAGHFEVDMRGFQASWWKITVENDSHQWRLNGDWKWPQDGTVQLVADLPPAD
jgi:hypothetical protein